jgi:hypothetical protein
VNILHEELTNIKHGVAQALSEGRVWPEMLENFVLEFILSVMLLD